MLDSLSLVTDELTEAMLEDKVTPGAASASASATATIALKCTPVMLGSALGNKGVQLLLDGVCNYLPEPRDVENIALDLDKDEAPVVLASNPDKPLVMLAFKLEDGRYGQLTYVRVYQGTISKDDFIVNSRNGKKVKVGRLVRMHSDDKEEITDAGAGDICAMFGVDCNSGDTFTDGNVNLAMTSMFVPDAGHLGRDQAEGLRRRDQHVARRSTGSRKEDPTFQCWVDPESSRDDHRRHGRAPPRRLHRAHEARVQGRGRDLAAAGRVPRDDHARRSSSTTRTRSRPVARVSTARSPATPSRSTASSSSSTRSRAARSRASSSRRARRASSR